jgi:hypothetical protein
MASAGQKTIGNEPSPTSPKAFTKNENYDLASSYVKKSWGDMVIAQFRNIVILP